MVLLGLAWMLALGTGSAEAASVLPAIGSLRNEVEQQYGTAFVIQEDGSHFWTAQQWAEKNKTNLQAKAYGYPFSVHGLKAVLWLEYDKKDRIVKETLLGDGNLKIRNFGQAFPELYAAITAADSEAALIRSYPRDQLAVRMSKSVRSERWVRFFFADDDKTCINMHSQISGFEIADVSPETVKGRHKNGEMAGCRFNGEVGAFPTDGTWNRADNYFLPRLFFSERLIPRQGTDLIVVHHAAMPTTTSRADIQELHLTNGWAGVGYHKLVFADGEVENGRPEQMVGAHAAGANRRSLGIVLVGDFNRTVPASVQLESAARLTRELMEKYRVPLENVRPHRAVTEGTDCPGQLFPWQEFVRMVSSGLK